MPDDKLPTPEETTPSTEKQTAPATLHGEAARFSVAPDYLARLTRGDDDGEFPKKLPAARKR